MSDEIIEAQRETIEAKNALIADLKAHIVELRARVKELEALRDACLAVNAYHWRELAEQRDYYTPPWVEDVARLVCAMRGIEVRS